MHNHFIALARPKKPRQNCPKSRSHGLLNLTKLLMAIEIDQIQPEKTCYFRMLRIFFFKHTTGLRASKGPGQKLKKNEWFLKIELGEIADGQEVRNVHLNFNHKTHVRISSKCFSFVIRTLIAKLLLAS